MKNGKDTFMDIDKDFRNLLNEPNDYTKMLEFDPSELEEALLAFQGVYLCSLNPEMHVGDDGTIFLTITIKKD